MTDQSEVQDDGERYFGVALIAYNDALTAALMALAELKGLGDLTWISEIQEASLRAVRSTISGRIPPGAEEGAMKFSIKVLDAAFTSIRVELTEGVTLSSRN
ncbi:hypothetical protein [Rhizobium brockwellii]|uniref:hypothetical protein n=1 Tax=Rhizobium TaxID=379 RepID=UPI003F94B2D9